MYKIEVKKIAKDKYQTHYAECFNYKTTTTEKVIFERHNASDLKYFKDDVNLYIFEDNKWFLIDHTLQLNNKYNIMLLEAQKLGFKNVFDAFEHNIQFRTKYTKKATN